MSCITRVLKLKGNKENFRLNESCILEGGGTYKGFEWCITFTCAGHRCGYVAISPTHPLAKVEDCNDLPISVHGGVSFFEPSDHIIGTELQSKRGCGDLWIGFDAMHGYDKPDLKLANKVFPEAKELIDVESFKLTLWNNKRTHRTYEYMARECKRMINQIIAHTKSNPKQIKCAA